MIEEKLEKIIREPMLFSIFLLGVVPYPYQKEFLESREDRILMVCGRQVGKTTMIAIRCIWEAITHKDYLILILAPTLRQSKMVIEKIRRFIEGNEFLLQYARKVLVSEVEFKNGSKIISLPAGKKGSAFNIRGYTADMVVIDESAYVPDEVFDAIIPSLMIRRGKLVLSGTPFGEAGFFYRCYQEGLNEGRWKIIKVKSEDCPEVSKEFLEEMRKRMSEIVYKQEFEAEFVGIAGLLFPLSFVRECLDDYRYEPHGKEGAVYYMGVDVARYGRDESAIVVVEEIGDEMYKVVYRETLKENSIPELERRVVDLRVLFRPKMILIDETGLGAGLVDSLKEKYSEVEGFVFTQKSRIEGYMYLRWLLEKKRIVLNANDEKMRLQFLNFKIEETQGGNITIKKGEGNDDLVDALMLAVYCGKKMGETVDVLDINIDEVF